MSSPSSFATRRRVLSLVTLRGARHPQRLAQVNGQVLNTIGLTAEQLRVAFPYVARLLQILPLGVQGSAIRRYRRSRNRDVT